MGTPEGISADPIAVVGGVYHERCMRPRWREIFGSAGRAASAIAAMHGAVELHGYVDPYGAEVVSQWTAFSKTPMTIRTEPTSIAVTFDYHHGLETPRIYGVSEPLLEIEVGSRNIIRFGMLESDARVHGDRVVYDPQNALNPRPFHENGSAAGELALVLNQHEASLMTGRTNATVEDMARDLLQSHGASVVVIKRGPRGALVFDGADGRPDLTLNAERSAHVVVRELRSALIFEDQMVDLIGIGAGCRPDLLDVSNLPAITITFHRRLSSHTYISALERGLKQPTVAKVDELAAVLDVHPLTLLALSYLRHPTPASVQKLAAHLIEEIDELNLAAR